MSRSTAHQRNEKSAGGKRLSVLVLSLVLLAGAAGLWWTGGDSSAEFAAAAMGRVGLVLAALWLAWGSLRRPARWLPPGLAVLGVIGLIVVASQPRLVLVIAPALATLLGLGTLIRAVKRSGS